MGTMNRYEFTNYVNDNMNLPDIISRVYPNDPTFKNLQFSNKINCPFHVGDNTPSCYIMPSYFKCFGCDAKGGIFRFIQLYSHVDFIESQNIIAEAYNIQIKGLGNDESNSKNKILEEAWNSAKVLTAPNSGTQQLLNEMSPFEMRQLTPGTPLYNYYRNGNYLVTPIYGLNNNIVGFSGRRLPELPENAGPKWLHTSAKNSNIDKVFTTFNIYGAFNYNKMPYSIDWDSETIKIQNEDGTYTIDKKATEIAKKKHITDILLKRGFSNNKIINPERANSHIITITEGPKDCAAACKMGLNAIATLGAHMSEDQYKMLIKNPEVKGFNIFYDGDDAGYRGISMVAEHLLHNKKLWDNTCVYYLDPDAGGIDPADLYKGSKKYRNDHLDIYTLTDYIAKIGLDVEMYIKMKEENNGLVEEISQVIANNNNINKQQVINQMEEELNRYNKIVKVKEKEEENNLNYYNNSDKNMTEAEIYVEQLKTMAMEETANPFLEVPLKIVYQKDKDGNYTDKPKIDEKGNVITAPIYTPEEAKSILSKLRHAFHNMSFYSPDFKRDWYDPNENIDDPDDNIEKVK